MFLAQAPKFDIPLDDPIYLFRSETMVINCKPSGGPIPKKTWKKDGQDLVLTGSNRLRMLENGDLEIKSVSDSDAGLYTCTATNSEGTAESSGTAVVLSKCFFNLSIKITNY